MSNYSIRELPSDERPRERFMLHGPEVMTSAELIAIILGSGMRGCSVLELSRTLLQHFGSLAALAEATVEELCCIKGIGQAKAIQLKAIFNLGARVAVASPLGKLRIDNPLKAYHLVKDQLELEKREVVLAILLDTKGFLITTKVISIGTLSHSLIHPREVFYSAIRHKASSLILAHNHPSGDPTPSLEDLEVTQELIKAGKLMQISLDDHIIVGQGKFISLRQEGSLAFS